MNSQMDKLIKPEVLCKSLNQINNHYQIEELVEFGKSWNNIQFNNIKGNICGINGYFCNKSGCNTCPTPVIGYPCPEA